MASLPGPAAQFPEASDSRPTDVIERAGPDVTAPKLIYRVEPRYSEEARRLGLQGTVILHVEIDQEGKVQNPRIEKGLRLRLDELALEAVRQWRFEPGRKGTTPVAVAAVVEIKFRLLAGPRQRLPDYKGIARAYREGVKRGDLIAHYNLADM